MSEFQNFLASCEKDLFNTMSMPGYKLMRRQNVVKENFRAVLTPVNNSLSYEVGGSEVYSTAKLIVRKADFEGNPPKENDTVICAQSVEKMTILAISSLIQEGLYHIELGR